MSGSGLSKPVIGIMGGIGSGKSLVAQQLGDLGCGVIDADQINRQVLERDEVKQQLVQWWGPTMLDASGQVDRRALGRLVFGDPQALSELESLTHPLIGQRRAELREQMMQNPQVVAIVEDAPLLLEKGIDQSCDVLVYVDVPREVRLERVKATRGWDGSELDRRQSQQASLDRKAQRADHIIRNDADPAACLSQVEKVLAEILRDPRWTS